MINDHVIINLAHRADRRFISSGGKRTPRNRAIGCPAAGGWRDAGGRESIVGVLGAAGVSGNGFDVWHAGVGVSDDRAVQRDGLGRFTTHARNRHTDGSRRKSARCAAIDCQSGNAHGAGRACAGLDRRVGVDPRVGEFVVRRWPDRSADKLGLHQRSISPRSAASMRGSDLILSAARRRSSFSSYHSGSSFAPARTSSATAS